MPTWTDVSAGPGGLVGVGAGWTGTWGWLVIALLVVLLALAARWISRSTRARGQQDAQRAAALRDRAGREGTP